MQNYNSKLKINKLKLKSLMRLVIIFTEVVLLINLLIWHLRFGLTRYFDADEVTHLHWGYSLLTGERPYTDFFYLFPPFFLYPIAAIMAIFGRTLMAVSQARAFIFIVFLVTTGVIFLLGKKLRNNHVGLLSAVIFAFLPIPFDKTIEVRPDLLATLFALSGLYLFILGQEGKQKSKIYYWASGLCFGLSLGFVPKTVFFLIPPLLVLGYRLYSAKQEKHLGGGSPPAGGESHDSPEMKRFRNFRHIIFFLSGLIIPIVVILFLLFSYGKSLFAIYSMTKMAADVTAVLGRKFYMRPDIFFYPNDTYYGLPGISQPLIANLLIYVFASLFAIFRFISLPSYLDRKKCQREFLVLASFWINLFAFVYLYPLKHAQYLILIVPFIAFYFADFLLAGLNLIKRGPTSIIFLFVILSYIFFVGEKMNQRKIRLTNKDTFDKLALFLKTIPANTPIFDLTGETIFFPNGYYFCCLPYGQYQEALMFNLPNLEKEFIRRNTKYIYTREKERLNVLPPLQAKYIRENFISIDDSFMVKKDLK